MIGLALAGIGLFVFLGGAALGWLGSKLQLWRRKKQLRKLYGWYITN